MNQTKSGVHIVNEVGEQAIIVNNEPRTQEQIH